MPPRAQAALLLSPVIQNQNFMYLVTNAKLCKHSLEEVVSQALGKWLGEGHKRSLTNSNTSNFASTTYQQNTKTRSDTFV